MNWFLFTAVLITAGAINSGAYAQTPTPAPSADEDTEQIHPTLSGQGLKRIPQVVGLGKEFVRSMYIERAEYSRNTRYGVLVALPPHPVREGKASLRFELHAGDCGRAGSYDDCQHQKERVELISDVSLIRRDTRGSYGWSVYFPKDFDQKDPVQSDLILGQFHADEHGMINFPTEFEFGYNASYRHGLVVRHSSVDPAYDDWRIRSVIPEQELRGRWHDIQVNAFWRSAKDGYFRVYVDDRLAYDFTGPTIQGQHAYFKVGIYRLYTEPPTSPSLVVYYDRIWAK